MKGGAVIDERSPEKEAMDYKGQLAYSIQAMASKTEAHLQKRRPRSLCGGGDI
jgi:hypothetical protein